MNLSHAVLFGGLMLFGQSTIFATRIPYGGPIPINSGEMIAQLLNNRLGLTEQPAILVGPKTYKLDLTSNPLTHDWDCTYKAHEVDHPDQLKNLRFYDTEYAKLIDFSAAQPMRQSHTLQQAPYFQPFEYAETVQLPVLGPVECEVCQYCGEPIVKEKLAPLKCEELMLAVAEGMMRMHADGIIYKNCHPDNIRINSEGKIVVCNFDGTDYADNIKEYAAKISHYTAPEILHNKEYTDATDTWSLGATLFFFVTGKDLYAPEINFNYEKLPLVWKQLDKALGANNDLNKFIKECLQQADKRPTIAQLMVKYFPEEFLAWHKHQGQAFWERAKNQNTFSEHYVDADKKAKEKIVPPNQPEMSGAAVEQALHQEIKVNREIKVKNKTYSISKRIQAGGRAVALIAYDIKDQSKQQVTLRLSFAGSTQAMQATRFKRLELQQSEYFQQQSHLQQLIDFDEYTDPVGRKFVFEVREHMPHRFTANQKLVPKYIPTFVAQVFVGLMQIHEEGLVYMNVKPDNVLLDDSMQIKLCGFDFIEPLASAEERVGTDYFVAPEIYTGDRYNQSVDSWGLGVTLYLLATGTYPFPSTTEVSHARLLKLQRKGPDYNLVENKKLVEIIQLCLKFDCRNRKTPKQILEKLLGEHPLWSEADWINAIERFVKQGQPPK